MWSVDLIILPPNNAIVKTSLSPIGTSISKKQLGGHTGHTKMSVKRQSGNSIAAFCRRSVFSTRRSAPSVNPRCRCWTGTPNGWTGGVCFVFAMNPPTLSPYWTLLFPLLSIRQFVTLFCLYKVYIA